MVNLFKKSLSLLKLAEETLLIVFVLTMVIIAFMQIILRNLSVPVSWIDPALRYLVLWAGMIAASLATNYDKHIKIDLVGRFAKGRFRTVTDIIINFTSTFVTIVLCLISAYYIYNQKSQSVSDLFGIKDWILLSIIPFSFFTISSRFCIRGIVSIINKSDDNPSEKKEEADSLQERT